VNVEQRAASQSARLFVKKSVVPKANVVYNNQPCHKQDPVDTRKGSASSVGSAVYVVNANAILQDTQGGERHRTKQSANARGLSTSKQGPPPPSPLKRQPEPER
jgi:hypothetical protein